MSFDVPRLRAAYETARGLLLAECRSDDGGPAHWTGELSTSPLSTATAVMAFLMVRKAGRNGADFGLDVDLNDLIRGGLDWLAGHQNDDGGWGDTVKSLSNISTTMLSHAVFHATREFDRERELGSRVRQNAGEQTSSRVPQNAGERASRADSEADDEADPAFWGTRLRFEAVLERAKQYIDKAGGVPAVVARYGKDKTFSVPILTHCALAGLVEWSRIPALPFELSCLPAKFYAAVRLPVVSYALPALIAIGQVRHHFCPTRNPLTRVLRNISIARSLRVLDRIQPGNGGFLEAAPLTSFVTMSLAGKGLVDHVVVQRAVGFLAASVRPDGSWPIDTNLATWTTTLAINALKDDVPDELRDGLAEWLLGQQYKTVHPFTNAAPGGFAWTNLPGGVPDADDTPGAMLALLQLSRPEQAPRSSGRRDTNDALNAATRWLLALQNRDGGFPTFCRGWGTLPFDRSSPDITAHCLRAINFRRTLLNQEIPEWLSDGILHETGPSVDQFARHIDAAMKRGFRFLEKRQRSNGSWIPLWFGNQYGHEDENPVYGTARVLMAYRDLGLLAEPEPQHAAAWLASVQQSPPLLSSPPSPPSLSTLDSQLSTPLGFGGDAGIAPSIEETALASEVLLDFEEFRNGALGGILWLIERVENGSVLEPSPIGFYFARLWYFEKLYPLIFAVSALRRAIEVLDADSENNPGDASSK